MRSALISTIITAGFLLGACSSDKGDESQTGSEVAPASTESTSASGFAAGVIDHSRDEQELILRQALYGVEDMLEHYRTEGYDTAELEQRKAELEKELQAF